MRRNIVAGNWKMNCDISQTYQLLDALKEQDITDDVSVIVAPPLQIYKVLIKLFWIQRF